MVLDLSILALCALTAALMAWPRLRHWPRWRAMITPLASIIGSGFLVLGPILSERFGLWAPLAMAGLCVAGWLFGAAVRANIAAINATPSLAQARLERVASGALGLAYVISVAYYLNLFGAFAVSLTPWHGPQAARIVTTAVFLVIAAAGFGGGFSALERMEYTSVSAKLAIIAGLLLGLAAYFWGKASSGTLAFNPPELDLRAALRLGFGLIVTVQGFETARYMGADYDAPTRIRAMRLAQILSSAIYMVYIALMAYIFTPDEMSLSETAIIDMMRVVAPILPGLLVAAALAAQFSAAVADTGGAGGLAAELSGGRVPARWAYLGLVVAGIALTWSANLYQIISIASRAFSAYYALQCVLAAQRTVGAPRWGYGAMALFGLAITVLATPAEGG